MNTDVKGDTFNLKHSKVSTDLGPTVICVGHMVWYSHVYSNIIVVIATITLKTYITNSAPPPIISITLKTYITNSAPPPPPPNNFDSHTPPD